jgi:6-phosphogluconolactonase
MVLRVVVAPTPAAAIERAAEHIAGSLRDALAARRAATLVLSGGTAGEALCAALAAEQLDWEKIALFQVDERVVARGDADRNLTAIERHLAALRPAPRVHAMPVEKEPEAAVAEYEKALRSGAGEPPAIDVAHLGLGADGHTASLFPGDPAAGVTDRTVTLTGNHAGYRRMTLTLPVLNSARQIVWLVTGAAKRKTLGELIAGKLKAPAGEVTRARAIAFVDEAAMPG